MRRRLALLAPALLVVACTEPDLSPRQMPPVTGAAYDIWVGPVAYVVTRSAVSDAPNGEVLRVYRMGAAALDYSEGLTAKTVAEAFCAQWNRGVNATTQGMFQATGAWVFPGGCA